MPYITPQKRSKFSDANMEDIFDNITNAGEFNYILSLMCKRYIKNQNLNYQTLNDIVGAMECCKLELTRRVISPYEDTKIKSNGDVY